MDQKAHEILAKYSKAMKERDTQIEWANNNAIRIEEIHRMYSPPLNKLARELADHMLRNSNG